MSDVERWSEWTASIKSVKRLDSGPFVVGSRARIRQPRLFPMTWVVTQIDPGWKFTWLTRSPGLTVTGHHVIQERGPHSRVTLAVEYDGPLGGMAARFWGELTHRYLALEAAGLKKRSEAVVMK